MTDTTNAKTLAKGLGWFSLGLGLFEVAAPGTLTKALGMQGQENLVRMYGMREIGAGIGILSQAQPEPWVWSRVGGDIVDLTTLGSAATPQNPQQKNVVIALAAVAGITALDILCGQQLSSK